MRIDANVLYGFDTHQNIDLSIERCLSLMDRARIDRAVICNLACKYYDFVEGNRQTYEFVKRYPDRFLGYASFHQSQYLSVEEDLERCIFEYGLFGVRFYNTMSGFMAGWGGGVNSLFMNRIYKKLERWDVPVLIEGGFPFDVISDIAKRFPGLKMIVSGTGYGNMSEAICAAQEYDNIYLEISTLDTMDGIRILTDHVADSRLVFGTGLPYNVPSAEILMVEKAKIPEESKERIFCENLLGLSRKENDQ